MNLIWCLFLIIGLQWIDSRTTFRVMNGILVNKTTDFPFRALVETIRKIKKIPTTFICGGSIIRVNAILTAAHCVKKLLPEDIKIYVGLLNHIIIEDVAQISKVSKYIIHERFNLKEHPVSNDIAVIILSNSLQINEFVQLIALPKIENFDDNLIATTIGWGYDENMEQKQDLYKTDLKIISKKECQFYGDKITQICQIRQNVTDNMLCAINYNQSALCFGDSGGPLVYKNTLVGVISMGWNPDKSSRTCSLLYPTIFVKVFNYISWIETALNTN